MEQRLRDIRTYVQRLATILELDEIVILDQNCVILRTLEQEATKQIGELDNLVLPLKSLGEDWDEKLAYACQEIFNLNTQRKLNSQILEAYYKLGALLAKK
ncbi:17075_t:CDS:2, partial [Gigaspora margarita]